MLSLIFTTLIMLSSHDIVKIEYHNETELRQHILQSIYITAEVMSDYRGYNIKSIINGLKDWGLIVHVIKTKYGDPGSCGDTQNPSRRCHGFVCDLPPYGWCVGYFIPSINSVFYAKVSECIADSSLAHEIIHAIEYIFTGYSNTNHDDPSLFPEGCIPIENIETRRKCYSESAERVIQSKLRKLLCDR